MQIVKTLAAGRHPGCRWLVALCLTLSALASLSVRAAPVTPPLAEAEAAFDQGDFAKALQLYETAAANGPVNGHVYYNLGLAAHRQGKVGEAMAAFLAARRFLPRDPDTAANLRFILRSVPDKLEAEQPKSTALRLAFWVPALTVREWAYWTAFLAAAVGGFLSICILLPRLKHLRLLALGLAILPLISGLSLAIKCQHDDVWAAVGAPTVKVYAGPGTKHPVLFELKEGAPLRIDEQVAGGFYRVELSDGKRGWIAVDQVQVFGPLGLDPKGVGPSA